jgi:hypothetical protein
MIATTTGKILRPGDPAPPPTILRPDDRHHYGGKSPGLVVRPAWERVNEMRILQPTEKRNAQDGAIGPAWEAGQLGRIKQCQLPLGPVGWSPKQNIKKFLIASKPCVQLRDTKTRRVFFGGQNCPSRVLS